MSAGSVHNLHHKEMELNMMCMHMCAVSAISAAVLDTWNEVYALQHMQCLNGPWWSRGQWFSWTYKPQIKL